MLYVFQQGLNFRPIKRFAFRNAFDGIGVWNLRYPASVFIKGKAFRKASNLGVTLRAKQLRKIAATLTNLPAG
jgi:hypothetical protein